jgi:hypothetical protein
MLVSAGCMRTYVGSGGWGVVSPDGSTHLCVTGHGAYGHAYIDNTKKLLDIWIWRNSGEQQTTLFEHRYKFVASDMCEDTVWTSPQAVVVFVFDYGDGVSSYDARKASSPSNHIATLYFELDKQTDKFVEKNQ